MAKSKIEQILRESASLLEDEINISKGEVFNPDDVVDNGVEGAYIEPVSDPDFTEEKGASDYVGKHVLFCNICMRPFFNDTEIDETTVCPMCQAESEDLVEVGIVKGPEGNDEDNAEGEGELDAENTEVPAVTDETEAPVDPEKEEEFPEEGAKIDGEAVNEDVTVNVDANSDATVTVNSDEANVDVDAGETCEPEAPMEPTPELAPEPVSDEEKEEEENTVAPEFDYEEESFNKLFSKFLTDNYKNVKAFNLIESRLTNDGLVLEGAITFDNDNVRNVTVKTDAFELKEGTSKVKAACPLFGKSKAFVIEHVMEGNKITPSKLNYRFRTRVNNESFDVIGRAVID